MDKYYLNNYYNLKIIIYSIHYYNDDVLNIKTKLTYILFYFFKRCHLININKVNIVIYLFIMIIL